MIMNINVMFMYCRKRARSRSRSRSPDRRHKVSDKERARIEDLRVKIDKAKLREIAM